VREDPPSPAEIQLVDLHAAVAAGANQLAPILGLVRRVLPGRRRLAANRRDAVEVTVDRFQLVVIVVVRVFVARAVRSAAVGIVRVVHAGAEVRVVEGFVLVVEPEVVPDFLAHH
jgi:hypothetical protein